MMELKKPIIDACIKSAQKNGWSDAMGLLRGALFLESEPLSLDALAERTGYSKTTIRTNMSYLENLGLVRRAVGPTGGQHHSKQHRYLLVSDAESMRQVILSAAKEEANLILQALLQVERILDKENLKEDLKEEALAANLGKEIQFYEEMSRILNLMSRFSSKELIEIMERECREL
jgi:DNA-binding transcriptional regulator GbsR (MarR family)